MKDYNLPSFFLDEVKANTIKSQFKYNKLSLAGKQVAHDLSYLNIVRCDENDCRCRPIMLINGSWKLFVTSQEFDKCIEMVHDDNLHCKAKKAHLGLKSIKTSTDVYEIYYSRGRAMIHTKIKECKDCRVFKQLEKHHKSANIACIYPQYLYAVIDFTSIQAHELKGYTLKGINLLMGVEAWSGYAYCVSTADQKSYNVVEFLKKLKCENTRLKYIKADRGTQFISALVHKETEALDLKMIHSRPYSPCSNGLVKRLNRTIKDNLAKMIPKYYRNLERKLNDDDVKIVLARCISDYNNTPDCSTYERPEYLFAGKNLPDSFVDAVYKRAARKKTKGGQAFLRYPEVLTDFVHLDVSAENVWNYEFMEDARRVRDEERFYLTPYVHARGRQLYLMTNSE